MDRAWNSAHLVEINMFWTTVSLNKQQQTFFHLFVTYTKSKLWKFNSKCCQNICQHVRSPGGRPDVRHPRECKKIANVFWLLFVLIDPSALEEEETLQPPTTQSSGATVRRQLAWILDCWPPTNSNGLKKQLLARVGFIFLRSQGIKSMCFQCSCRSLMAKSINVRF